MKTVTIYTDGACSGNPGIGGYAGILQYEEHEKIISGGEMETTNNRMEVLAVIKALEALKEPCKVYLHSDSAYVCNAFTENWLFDWQNNNWKTNNGKKVKNIELWQRLAELTKTHQVTFVKVKGHADDENNNRCDKIARAECKKIADSLKQQ